MRKTLLLLALASASVAVYAASTGTTQLQTVTGSGAGSANGDFVSDSDPGALNTAYRYFIEVPPGLPALNVEIFDADIGLGGTAEAAAGRDRARTAFNTIAAYSLIGPDGVARRTTFTTGSVTAPVGADNAWLSFFSSTGDTVRDDFTTVAYTNNDGTVNWAGNWLETNDNNSANNGNIVITGGQLRIRDNGDAAASAIEREANLSGWTTATLTFDVSTQNVEPGDQVRVDVSANGGGSWTTLETFTGAVTGSRTYSITGFIASNTRVRFITVGTGYTGTDSFLVDNLQIKNSVIRNGHWELRVDQSSAVTGTTASDINAFGIRAHDGNSGSGGVELAVYADSFVGIGVNPPTSGTASRNYTLYPYVTSGCTCGSNDFDFDSNSGTVGSKTYTSRSGSFLRSFNSSSLSLNNAWARNDISNWTSAQLSTEYGIWQLSATITSYINNGAPNGNYATMWDSNFAAAANPPTANPQANALRLYFPSDAGAAPVKPYLEQVLTNRAQGLLPIGTPTRFTVTVRVVNPTPYPITFSATHLVTANVPGAGAVYGGNAQVGQGTIVSQPAVGGTGNVTWNPGTVAAGVTTILAYDVVVTASAGQPVPVTGTPASGNGTRATFVDETGNTTQARALYTLGPICQLNAVQGSLTEVLLSSFEANVHGSAAVVTWETASEAGTIGFNLYRVDNTGALTPVNDTLLTANAGAPQGGRYRFVDVHITDDAPSYMLEELTADGRTVQYGPFAATAGGDDVVTGDVYEQEPHSNGQKFAPPGHGRKAKPDAAIVGVRVTGLTRVTASDLAATLAMPEASVRAAMATGRISITDRGADVAWLAEADNASLLFFAQASDSIFSNERMYRIALDRGTPMRSAAVIAAPEQITTFTTTQQFEKDALSVTVLPLDPNSDYWFWDFVSSGNATAGKKTFVIDVPAVASTSGAVLEVRMQGALAQNTHHARVSINGTRIGDAIWTALNAYSGELAVPTGVLRDGANTILIEGVLENGARSDLFYIDGFAMQYVRFARAVNGTLDMQATPGDVVTAAGFTAGPIALDVSQRRQPVLLTGAGASFVVPQNATALFFSDPAAVSAPNSIRAAANASLSERKNRADYLIITNDALRDGANALAQLRARDGLVTFIVDVDDIYDEFSGGNVTPYAIRDFLSATRSWSRAPRYVVLAGIGTLDYRNLTVGPGLIPPFMTKTSNGLFAADSLFTDFDSDGLPDLAIGRIPVTTNAQMLAYVAKLDGSAQASNGTPVFSADAFDRGANFKNESAIVESSLAGRSLTHVYIDDLGTTARASFLGAWRNGSPLVSWLGHGGVDRISKTSLLTTVDAPSLVSTSGQLPVFVAMTCTINRFELGSVQSLGTALTVAPNAGALAVWSASGLSSYRDATQLEQTFVRLAANSETVRIGDLVLQSLAANKSIGETANIYLLLGDPAIPLSLPGPSRAIDHQPGDPE